MSLTEDVARLLESRGHGTYRSDTIGGSIFLGDLPPEPAVALAVNPYPGVTANSKIGDDRPRVQIVNRGETYAAAEAAAEQLYFDLIGLRRIRLGPAWLVLINGVNNRPIRLYGESGGRQVFATNLELLLHQTTTHRA